MNVPMIFISKRTLVQPRIRGTNLVTRYIFTEVSCAITNKGSYIYDETWENLVKLVSPGIINMKVINIACVLPIFLYTYITIHICHSKLSADSFCFP